MTNCLFWSSYCFQPLFSCYTIYIKGIFLSFIYNIYSAYFWRCMGSLLNTVLQQYPLGQSTLALPFPSYLIPLPFCYTLSLYSVQKKKWEAKKNSVTSKILCSAVLDYHPLRQQRSRLYLDFEHIQSDT